MKLINAPRFGTGVGLSRVGFLLHELGIEREWLERTSIAITGSNGKGSTALLCSDIAAAHGLRAGLFTSPHLYRLEERIRIDGNTLEGEDFTHALERVQTAAGKYRSGSGQEEEFGAFELVFAAAVDIFFRRGCDVCVYEAGIGGRYDPVRLARAGIAALTSLDLEHTSLLGGTLELICYDKIDICSNGGTVFFGENCRPLSERIAAYCELRNVKAILMGREIEISDVEVRPDGTRFTLRAPGLGAENFTVSLTGRHQANNAALAIALFHEWSSRFLQQPLSPAFTRSALTQSRWPGRLERIADNPQIIIDVGHTPDGVKAALGALREAYPDEQFVLVTGVSVDKDAESMLELLAPSFNFIVATQAYFKGRPAEEIALLASKYAPAERVTVATTVEAAFSRATDIAKRENCSIYVAGGMYVAVEFAQAARGVNPRELPHL